MFKLNTPQKVFKIGSVQVGGKPGERPIVLVGSIFYLGQRILSPHGSFSFDEDKAAKLLNAQDSFAEKTGNPSMVDLIISSPAAVEREINFVVDNTESPVLIDAVSFEAKSRCLQLIKELGLNSRVVYNSINTATSKEELDLVKDSGVEASVLLAYSSSAFTSTIRVETVKKLLTLTSQFITKPLIDTYVLDIPSLGMACKAMQQLKSMMGLPVGGGTENAVATWKGLESKMGVQSKNACVSSAAVMAACSGADFILYGPIERCEYVFPAVAMADAAIQQNALEEGAKPNRDLPLFKIG